MGERFNRRIELPEMVDLFCSIMDFSRSDCPSGVPGLSKELFPDTDLRFYVRLNWQRFLVSQQPNWQQARTIAENFKTSLPPPHNPWFLDLPIEWIPEFMRVLSEASIEEFNTKIGRQVESFAESKYLRIKGGVAGWNAAIMNEMPPPDLTIEDIVDAPGPKFSVEDYISLIKTFLPLGH